MKYLLLKTALFNMFNGIRYIKIKVLDKLDDETIADYMIKMQSVILHTPQL